tara:strand:+ start:1564 stop:2259 length:696 start_codon:yes stop_codon:yes gene_type:complete
MTKTALIVGAGRGLSAAFARRLSDNGYKIALAARNIDKLSRIASDCNAICKACDCGDSQSISELYDWTDTELGDLSLVLFNASGRLRGAIEALKSDEVKKAILTSCYGGFMVGQEAAKRMLGLGRGAIFFTGASASIKGYPKSSPFAIAKFGLRGFAQSLARELAPKNIHVAHFVIDGGISTGDADPRNDENKTDGLLKPEAIADTYFQVLQQHRSAWSWEVELRPWCENF